MDQRERSEDLMEAMRTALDGRQAKMWQGGPGIIQSFDAAKMTVVVQPAVQGRASKSDGSVAFVNLPLLLDVPVQFPSGGGVTLTFPIKKGDECWFSIADRCIDAWWQQGGIQSPMEARMHDLSDACAFVGVRSQPRVLANVSTSHAQLRSDDGLAFVDLDPAGHVVTITAPGGITLNGPVTATSTMHVQSDVTVDTKVTATNDVIGGGKHLATHTHGGVQAGGGNTGAPN